MKKFLQSFILSKLSLQTCSHSNGGGLLDILGGKINKSLCTVMQPLNERLNGPSRGTRRWDDDDAVIALKWATGDHPLGFLCWGGEPMRTHAFISEGWWWYTLTHPPVSLLPSPLGLFNMPWSHASHWLSRLWVFFTGRMERRQSLCKLFWMGSGEEMSDDLIPSTDSSPLD